MALLSAFGALFGLPALDRRSRREGARFRLGKNCCSFFHLRIVFLLTLVKHESIHFSTAITIAGRRTIQNIVERENRQMATKKAPAKKALKKAAKKVAKKK